MIILLFEGSKKYIIKLSLDIQGYSRQYDLLQENNMM